MTVTTCKLLLTEHCSTRSFYEPGVISLRNIFPLLSLKEKNLFFIFYFFSIFWNSYNSFHTDAKWKILVGEPDFPLACVAHGKKAVVGLNKLFNELSKKK